MHVVYRLKQMGTRALKGPVAVAILLSSYSTQAQQCPEVSIEQCNRPEYLDSFCGRQQLDECSQLIVDAFGAVCDATPNEHLTVLPDSMGGGQEVTKFVPYSYSDQQVIAGGGTYAGVVNKSHLISAKDSTDFTADDQEFFAMKQRWTEDGIRVNSCEEFVYKRYYDYSVFEDTWGSLVFDDGDRGSNYRAILRAALAPDGIANRTLMSIDGVPIASQFGETAIPKNAYYTFQVGPYPVHQPRYPWDEELIAQVDPRGRDFYRPTFDWHQQMSDSLSKVSDDELELRAAEQKSFAQLMQRRRDLWQSYQEERRLILLLHLDPSLLDRAAADALFEIDRDLEGGLRNASQHGCLTLEQPTPCDCHRSCSKNSSMRRSLRHVRTTFRSASS